MHPRNIYNIRPNFADLAKKYSFFAPFLTLDETGNPKINFKDANALRALSKALLLKDFELDVEIPENALIPTIPLRLNYILWVEDLLQGAKQSGGGLNEVQDVVRGIDVGTGATAVYALLGARKNNWVMTGTELNQKYVEIAQKNVDKNKLSHLVRVVPSKPNSPILTPILNGVDDYHFAFTMCNPPFFESDEETDSVTKGRLPLRQPPSAAKTGQTTELVADGGELAFVQGLIEESVLHPRKVSIYTTMLGIKRHFKQLIKFLRSHNIANYTTTELIQGKTMRWGLAWSFTINLLPPEPDLIVDFPKFSPLINFESLMSSYLSELNFHTFAWLPSSSDDVDVESPVLEIVAMENTWSKQRRKRRFEQRLLLMNNNLKSNNNDDQPMDESTLSSPKVQKSHFEQASPDSSESSESTSSSAASGTMMDTHSKDVNSVRPILIHCFLDFVRDEEEDGCAKILMRFREGIYGKESLHQIQQYLKNRYDKDLKDPTSTVFQMMSSTSTK